MLRNTQFREDAGPTAHPVKPAEYQAIDNFYTTTIYEKGSELIRMLHTLLGAGAVHARDGAVCEPFRWHGRHDRRLYSGHRRWSDGGRRAAGI